MRVGNAQQAGVGRTPRHHVLPQEFRDWFKARGVDVDQYCVELQQGDHSAIHTMDYNKALMGAMQRQEKVVKHKLKPAEILEVARGVMAQFKIDSLPFVPFQGGDDKKGKGK